MTFRTSCLLASASLLMAGTALAAPGDIYLETFDDGLAASRWVTTTTSAPDTVANFAYDYSADGLTDPAGGAFTLGAAFNPNVNGSVPSSVFAMPSALNVTGDYSARFYYAYVETSGSGTTEAAFFGINGTPDTPEPVIPGNGNAPAGIGYAFATDEGGGGSQPSVAQYLNSTETRLYDNYGQDADGILDDLVDFPSNFSAEGPDKGVWHLIDIVSEANQVKLFFNGKLLDTIDNTGGDDAGSIWIGAADRFGSEGDHLHIFDAIEVTTDIVPEPATAALLGLGGLAMLRRRSA